jgi:hypothetical protein
MAWNHKNTLPAVETRGVELVFKRGCESRCKAAPWLVDAMLQTAPCPTQILWKMTTPARISIAPASTSAVFNIMTGISNQGKKYA